MDWMYANCSATAQRGALDWKPRFKKAVLPVFRDLYQRVKTGKECARVLSSCGRADYKKQLTKELNALGNSEMWRAGKAVRSLRPKEAPKAIAKGTKGVAGRAANWRVERAFQAGVLSPKAGRRVCCRSCLPIPIPSNSRRVHQFLLHGDNTIAVGQHPFRALARQGSSHLGSDSFRFVAKLRDGIGESFRGGFWHSNMEVDIHRRREVAAVFHGLRSVSPSASSGKSLAGID
jgi:hypothetical protein